MGYHNATVDKTRKNGLRPWAHYLTCNSAHAGHGCSNRRYFNYLYLENFILSGTIDDLDIVAAVGIHVPNEATGEPVAALRQSWTTLRSRSKNFWHCLKITKSRYGSDWGALEE
jgi:hypothetical protein